MDKYCQSLFLTVFLTAEEKTKGSGPNDIYIYIYIYIYSHKNSISYCEWDVCPMLTDGCVNVPNSILGDICPPSAQPIFQKIEASAILWTVLVLLQ
jgi:hypothetical protein